MRQKSIGTWGFSFLGGALRLGWEEASNSGRAQLDIALFFCKATNAGSGPYSSVSTGVFDGYVIRQSGGPAWYRSSEKIHANLSQSFVREEPTVCLYLPNTKHSGLVFSRSEEYDHDGLATSRDGRMIDNQPWPKKDLKTDNA